MKDEEFTALVIRLNRASDALRERGCLIQSLARRYYLLFTYALQAAERHKVTFRRGTQVDDDRRLTHGALPDIVRALYTGTNSGAVLGGGPGITRAGRMADREASTRTNLLQKDRIYADYGYMEVPEPYSEAIVDERMGWANHLVEDLGTLL